MIVDGFERNEILIPVTEEMLIDSGHLGPRHRLIPDSAMWRQRWKERPNRPSHMGFAGLTFPMFDPPAYEWPDRGLQLDVHPFPRWDAAEAWARPKITEARRRITNAIDMLKGADPECTADHW